ncbi:bifunctional riboflavin kinase/FAD synthetase [Ornithinibacillus bavariensis]|uniref:bifunctional riboflavin kinase/FAD synthetase n=1 Tax=Ornithinibacillus bavariensis TaxID=545502 RepID=UPI000ED8A28C|nr:bifunctional riboflavin kinase/FAD synthetase [Ornithinibacillus sp.]
MKTIYLTYPHNLKREEVPETVAAIGFFDGLHRGHQTVIKHAVNEAKQKAMASAVITFYPHPSVVLKNNHDVKYITPLHEKQEILDSLNVDILYIITFNKELSSQSPQDFIDHFIIGLNIKHVVAGFDFTYGHKGQGNMEVIGEHSRGAFSYTMVDKVTLNNEKISSTKIRSLLDSGDIEQANVLLGRALSISGKVIHGDQRGRELGYPTANINYNEEAHLPKPGIYAVCFHVDGQVYGGMASLGTNPTFTEGRLDLSLEVYIFDFNQDIYGKDVVVEWYKFIRNEEKFDSVEALIERMQEDEKEIRKVLAELS